MRKSLLALPLLFILAFFSRQAAGAWPVNSGSVKDTVTGIEPVDASRVLQISKMLQDDPKGFGAPCQQRKVWDQLKASGRYRHVLKEADQLMTKGIPAWDENLYMGFFTKGDSQSGKDLQTNRMRAFVQLVWAECIDNRGKYLPAIQKALEQLITQKTWVHPRNFNPKNFDGLVELSTASYAQNIAQAIYLLNDKLDPKLRRQAIQALYQRAFNPLLKTIQTGNSDHGWLTGTNNWNAVCLSGVTGAALAVIPDKKERATFIAIAERYIQNFVSGFPSDGYCTEGLSYFNYGFGRYITLREIVLAATNKKLDLFKENAKIEKIAWFLPNMEIIHGIYPAIGDCKQLTQPSAAILRYVNNSFQMGLADEASSNFNGKTSDLQGDLMNAFSNSTTFKKPAPNLQQRALPLRSFFDVAGVLTVRPAAIHEHTMAATLKGGNNNEHHNHNDLGSFSIVVGHEMLVGDPGSIPYTAKTFSEQRYEYKTLGSYGHPVPLVAGTQQRHGAEAQARIREASFSNNQDIFSMDITTAYAVQDLKTITRTFTYTRGKKENLQVQDTFAFARPQIFESAIITRYPWKKIAPDQLLIEGKTDTLLVTIICPQGAFSIESEQISEENSAPYERIAVRLDRPERAGQLELAFSPVSH